MNDRFRIGITRDFLKPDGTIGFGDIGLRFLEVEPGVEWEFLAEDTRALRADQVRDYDALLVLSARITAASLEGAGRLALIARFGVGYDSVDVDVCTRAAVLLTITPDGVRRPVATSVRAMLLALSHKLLIKDRLARAGRWTEKLDHMGMGLTGRALGVRGGGRPAAATRGQPRGRKAAPLVGEAAPYPFARGTSMTDDLAREDRVVPTES